MRQADVDSPSAEDYFRRRNPSQFMSSLIDALTRQIEADWGTAPRSSQNRLKRIVGKAIEGVLVSGGFYEVTENWDNQRFRWITRMDEKVCPECGPRHGSVFIGVENGPRYETHYWRCRWVGVPVSIGWSPKEAVLLGGDQGVVDGDGGGAINGCTTEPTIQ